MNISLWKSQQLEKFDGGVEEFENVPSNETGGVVSKLDIVSVED